MKESEYKDVEVQCPFYKKEDKQRIRCEGVTTESTASVQVFKSKTDKNSIKEKYCTKDYMRCPTYQALEKKYT